MQYKTKPLPYDWGHIHNGNYSVDYMGGSCSSLCMNNKCTEEYVRAKYDAFSLIPNRTHSYFSSDGLGRFWSTTRKKPHFNNCDNKRVYGLNHPYGGVFRTLNKTYMCNAPYFYRNTPQNPGVESVEKHPLIDFSAAQRTAWHTMQEEFAGNISLINFIYELKDFKDILKFAAKSPLKKIRNYSRRFWTKLKGDRGLFDPTLPLAKTHLANEFAIKPLISDLVNIHKQMYDVVMDAQSEFALKGMAGNTRHYSEDFVLDQALTKSSKWWKDGMHYQTRFTATLDYTFTYECRSFFEAFTRYWGLEFTAEALWNMIPFSFLLDYVLKVGNAVAIMEHDPRVKTFVSQYCESLCTERTYGAHIDCDYHASPVIVNNKFAYGMNLVSGSKASLYTRRVTAPNKGAVLPRLAAPSLKQGVNTAALLRVLL